MRPTVNKSIRPRPASTGQPLGLTLGLAAMLLAAMSLFTPSVSAPKLKHRSLIIFAPDTSSTDLSKQKEVVAQERDGLQQRDIVVVYVIGQDISAELGPEPTAIPVKLRSHFKVPRDDFRVVLIGKDSQTEMLSDVPVTADQLFQTIDATPGRQDGVKPPG